jgi:RNA polymerase sigma-70 factor (ECF subfamily)
MERKTLGEMSDENLVILAQRGTRQAFEVLVDRYKHEAYRIAFDFTREQEEAKDVSQDAFLRAFTGLRGFQHNSTFHTWFYRILVNLCLDYRRRNDRIRWRPIDPEIMKESESNDTADPSSSPERNAMAGEASQRLRMALEALPPKQRTAFLLRNDQGLSIHEVARTMKSADGTVRVYIHRAVIALKQSLAKFASGGIE